MTDLVNRYNDGVGIQTLRKRTGLGHNTFVHMLRAAGVKIRDQQEAARARSDRAARLAAREASV
ncbi:hypothetical protein ACFZB9_13670 [Kitasatospora sp. NPDC008050]|uniref:hypothetical protein n=1 Tax=Kitasatospora sp. NPDC008050 TaxID=3364021 RepID=UPI0036E270BB